VAKVIIYTDGACRGNPGIGGWGAVLMSGNKRKEIFGGALQTTNNQMELQAVIEALKLLKFRCQVQLYSDSSYVVDGATKWMANWQRNDWAVAKKKKIKNLDRWQQLAQLMTEHDIVWQWVKAHADNVENNRADALANLGADSVQQN